MGTYAVNIYGWLICKLSVPQRTIESKHAIHIQDHLHIAKSIYR
jgi:hypothetical protein